MTLAARDLTWHVRRQAIVDGINLDVAAGETLGLVGPNGSGKSTLLRLLAGILAASRGTVELGGRSLQSLSRREVAQCLAFVEQQADTGERLMARDAVELGRTPWLSAAQRWSGTDDAIVERSLQQVDMRRFADREWHTLSGGERQRLHIARALAQEPRILLLDEPTNHLDIEHQLAILHLVRTLAVTTVIAMHDLNQALGCDRVCVLDRGQAVAIGRPEAVLTTKLLRDVFRVDARFVEDSTDGSRVIRFGASRKATAAKNDEEQGFAS